MGDVRRVLSAEPTDLVNLKVYMHLGNGGGHRCDDQAPGNRCHRRRKVDDSGAQLDPDRYTVEGRVVTIHNPPAGADFSFSWGGSPPATSPPVADFAANPASGVAPLSVTFTDTSTGSPTSRGWDFGDGSAGGGSIHRHTYAEPGTYTVSLTVTNAAGSDSETKTGLITVTEPVGPQPDAWNPSTMLGPDLLHPNDAGMTYLADCYEWALANAGKTPAAGTLITAYGDSFTAADAQNTAGMRAIHQLRDRLGLTLTNQAVSGDRAGDCAATAIGTTGTFAPGTGGIAFLQVGVNDVGQADTTQHRTAIANYLRAWFAVVCAAQRTEETGFTYVGTWGNPTGVAGASGGANRNAGGTSTGTSASITITTPGTYYLLTHGTDTAAGFSAAGKLVASQGGVTLATQDLQDQAKNTGRLLTANYGPLSMRIPNVQAGTLTITVDRTGRVSTADAWIDALVRISSTPPTILAAKPVRTLDAARQKPALLDYIRDLYDTLAAEFGANVVVCDPDPSWTP